jgi:hypothetical protein
MSRRNDEPSSRTYCHLSTETSWPLKWIVSLALSLLLLLVG